ncbi:heavy metal-binding protein HIP-like [Ruditapes philippinarum]|uniref:heavy metal-binding protein HIP-like n=1 Tax=Ruditapes philippinarum TaxID=129788 RepID=UPI00295B9950|nr:heavy metal-binding protein HIP-like [Ruditapes philippinarum]
MLETMVRMEAKMNQWNKEKENFEENMLSVMEHRKVEMKQEFAKQNQQIGQMLADYTNFREELNDKTAQLENRVGNFTKTPKIAFNAYTRSGKNYDNGQTFVFPDVLLNEGGGYDKITGMFTAPVTGLFFFSVHICQEVSKYVVAAIVHGHTTVAVTSEYESIGASCSSVMAPVKMTAGERVYVKCPYPSVLRADSSHRWPSFTGVLLNI